MLRKEKTVSDSRLQAGDFGRVHFGEAEALASEIFQGGPDEVEFAVVDGEETVVEGGALQNGEGRVLGVELRDVTGRKPVAAPRGDDFHFHALAFLRKDVERSRPNPAVDEPNRGFRPADQPLRKQTGIPQLPVVEDALQGGLAGADEEIDPVLQFGKVLVVRKEPTVDGGELRGKGGPREHPFLDHACRPLAEADAHDGVDAVAYGDDGIQVVVDEAAGDVPEPSFRTPKDSLEVASLSNSPLA